MNMDEALDKNEKYLNANELSIIIGCTVPTIAFWYRWKKMHPDDPKAQLLPDPIRVGDPIKGKRYWKFNDVYSIMRFRAEVKLGRGGFMADATQKYRRKKKEKKDEKKD